MAKNKHEQYDAEKFGGEKEKEMMNKYYRQKTDAKTYFLNCVKPRLDRSYKLYMSDNSDRAKEIQGWQANVSVPYIHGVVESLKPRILDARPEFSVKGRTEDDQRRAKNLQALIDYTWERAGTSKVAELLVHSCLVYGTGFLQVSWKKDEREMEFLQSDDVSKKKLNWKKKKQIFYDAPYVEHVDNYSLWYDWHNTEEENKQYWFKRLILPESVIRRKYNMAQKKRLDVAFNSNRGDLTDYASVRTELKTKYEGITRNASYDALGGGNATEDIYKNSEEQLHEVFEWTRPYEDKYSVMVNDVPVLKGGAIPIPYDFKESMFIGVPYLRVAGEYEGYGMPMILENPQIMLNMIKNQRLDATTLNIHKMWIVNPIANINKEELVARPFGIIYSNDPNGVHEVQTTDINQSAYREEELLKSDMRYASGVDDYSMGSGGGADSATEVRHLRESTLERVRLFIDHLGEGYSKVMRYWISLYKQFGSKEMTIRIIGDDGNFEFPIIQKDDLKGYYDYMATVIPSIAGQEDMKKKQDMDLFQLLGEMPFIDLQKLTQKLLYDWNWDIHSIKKDQGQEQGQGDMSPAMQQMMQQAQGQGQQSQQGGAQQGGAQQTEQAQAQAQAQESSAAKGERIKGTEVPPDVAERALAMLSGGQQQYNQQTANSSPYQEAATPVNLLRQQGAPPTPQGAQPTTNPRGMNRKVGGGVNTNISLNREQDTEGREMNRANNPQR